MSTILTTRYQRDRALLTTTENGSEEMNNKVHLGSLSSPMPNMSIARKVRKEMFIIKLYTLTYLLTKT